MVLELFFERKSETFLYLFHLLFDILILLDFLSLCCFILVFYFIYRSFLVLLKTRYELLLNV